MNGHTPATFLGELLGELRQAASFPWRLEARLKGVQFLGKTELIGRPIISVAKGATMIIGDGVQLYSAKRANPLGLFQPCVLRALETGAKLVLGRKVGLSGSVVCAASSIEIGDYTLLGAGVMVLDTDFHQPEGEWNWTHDRRIGAKPVKIGRGVFIGARAIILKGVTIGDRAIIGAGAVVTQDVPERYIAVGNPARVVPVESRARNLKD